jgi:hypothetical protein
MKKEDTIYYAIDVLIPRLFRLLWERLYKFLRR